MDHDDAGGRRLSEAKAWTGREGKRANGQIWVELFFFKERKWKRVKRSNATKSGDTRFSTHLPIASSDPLILCACGNSIAIV